MVQSETLQDTGHDDRARAGVAVLYLDRGRPPVVEGGSEDPFGAGLGEQAGYRPDQPRLVARRAAGPLRILLDGVDDPALGRAGLGNCQRPEHLGQPAEGQREQRCAAAVDTGMCDLLAGQFGDRVVDRDLQRMLRGQVALGRPAVDRARDEHRRVLSRTVGRDRRPLQPLPGVRDHRDLIQRPARSVPQERLVQAGGGQDLAGPLDVEALSGVARCGKREEFSVQREPEAQHCRGLGRLVGGAGVHRGLCVADCEGDDTGGVQRDHRAAVTALHHPGADDLGDHIGARPVVHGRHAHGERSCHAARATLCRIGRPARTAGVFGIAELLGESLAVRAVVQRVSQASVTVGGEVVGAIDPGPGRQGLLVLLGVTHSDTIDDAKRLARKVWEQRILDDERSASDLGAPVLVVSQFTLYADTGKGRRPSWSAAAPRSVAEPLVDAFCAALRTSGAPVETGAFGAHMLVTSTNDGPVTLLLES